MTRSVHDTVLPRVAIIIDKKGDWSVKTDTMIEIFCVDENAPDDRVYKMDARRYTTSPKRLSKLLEGNPQLS